MAEDLCLYDVADGIATLTFNRPDSMNGMTGNMEVAYFERLRQAEADTDVRVIVLTWRIEQALTTIHCRTPRFLAPCHSIFANR